jgi:Fic family protein
MSYYYGVWVDDSCLENKNLITNFIKKERPIYQKAIEKYGWDGLYISEDAYWRNGTKDNSLLSLRYKGDQCRNLSEFWKIFRELRDKSEA